MTKVDELHKAGSEDPEYRAEYDRLGPEFALARSLIEARTRALPRPSWPSAWRRPNRWSPGGERTGEPVDPDAGEGRRGQPAPGFGSISTRHKASCGDRTTGLRAVLG